MQDDERLRGPRERDVELACRDQRRFDHVVVVEPALIPLRELYVALTRPTKRLVVLHARDLPRQLR